MGRSRRLVAVSAMASLVLVTAPPAHAASGDPDPSFGTGNLTGTEVGCRNAHDIRP